MIDLRTAAPFARRFRGRTIVVKVGGACLERAGTRRRLAEDVAVVHALGAEVVLVHGAGPQVDALQRALGEEPHKIGGRRVTSALALRALRHATLGELNGELAALLTAAGAPALGVCAGTAGVLTARRRPPVVTAEGTVDFGHVGDLVGCDARPLRALLDAGVIPVLSPPARGGAGAFLNVNADLAAAHVATALGAHKLVLVTATAGILTEPDDAQSLVSSLTLAELDALAGRGVLRDGMEVKARAIRHALDGGVGRVHVVSGIAADGLLGELYTTHGTGTLVTVEPEEADIESEELVPSAPPAAVKEVLG